MAGILEATKEERQILKLDGLLSLWDMLRVYADKYISLGIQIGKAQEVLSSSETAKDEGYDIPLSRLQIAYVKGVLVKIESLCNELSLPTSLDVISTAVNEPPRTAGELKIIIGVVESELKTRLFLFIPPHRSEFHGNSSIISERARLAFPSILSDMRDAGNAYATGLYNACVYHLMRAVEIGLQKLATKLNVAFPDRPIDMANMKTIIDVMDKRIREYQNLPNTPQKNEELTFYSRAAIQYDHFKEAHRNQVAHARSNYDESQALSIMRSVQEFYNTISEKLSE